MEEAIKELDPEMVWKMAEGNPAQDLTSGGEVIKPQPILQLNVYRNNSDQKNLPNATETQDSARRDGSIQNNLNPALPDSKVSK